MKCYTEAIEGCPKESAADLATFHQNRAAAHEQLGDLGSVVEDCTAALEMNPKYVKALDRRAKAGRKQVRRGVWPGTERKKPPTRVKKKSPHTVNKNSC